MTDHRPFVFQRTPSRSPDRIFAPPITPIVIDSSPLTIPSLQDPLSASRSAPSRAPNSPSTSSPNTRNDTSPTLYSRVALARNISKENVAVTIGGEILKDGKNNCEIFPQSGSVSPVKLSLGLGSENGQQGKTKRAPKKARRTRETESKTSTNTLNKTLKGRVTKSSQNSQSSTKTTKDLSHPPSPERKTTRARENEAEELNLEEAMRRRTDWTPIKDTLATPIDLTQTPSTGEPVVQYQLGNLVERYGYARESSEEGDSEVLHPVPMKKRRLELVGTSGRESTTGDSTTTEKKSATSTRTKKPRKAKTTTITALTTAQYETTSTSDTNLHSYFSPNAAAKQPVQGKSRTRKTTSKAKGRGAKETSLVFNVAPATDAIKSLDAQVLLFGTCSQLARDCSPGREEQKDRGFSTKPSKASNSGVLSPGLSSLLSKRSGSKCLWGAGARDLEGGLADIEVVDLQKADAPNIDRPLHKETLTAGQSEDSFMDVDDVCQNSAPEERAFPDESLGSCIDIKDVEQGRNDQLRHPASSSVPKTNSDGSRECSVKVPEPVVDLLEQTECGQSSSSPSSEQAEPVQSGVSGDVPHFRGFSTAELNKQVAAYGFKPVKTRDAAISLLEKCWESRNKISSTKNISGKRASNPPPVPATRKTLGKSATKARVVKASASDHSKLNKGRSSKSSQSSEMKKSDFKQFASTSTRSSFEEIADSTDEDTVAAPSHDIYYDALSYSNQKTMTPPSTLTIRSKTQSSHDNADKAPDIHKQITLAVKGQPRMNAVKGIKQPTWYEKILMYDPILLDDLTVWLNIEGLNRVGEDREVDRLTVREWCESKGVCCTWRKAGHRRK